MLGLVSLLCTLHGQTVADQSHAPAPAPTNVVEHEKPRALPAAAALMPGLVLHGSGHFAQGNRATAYSLLKWEGVGVGALLVGATGLALTGASRHTVSLLALTSMAGAGLLAITWLADLYGVLAPAGGTGDPLRQMPWLQATAGVKWVDDPTLSGSVLVGTSLQVWTRRWRLCPSAWFAANGDTSRMEGDAAYRFVGPVATGQAATGSFVDLELGAYHHRYQESQKLAFPSRFRITGVQAQLQTRLDLLTIAPTLRGAFIEGSAGVGIGAYRYPDVHATVANTILLGGFAFGLYLGKTAQRWGQWRVFYNHRHDDFVGGLKTYGLGSGALGYFGTDVRAFLTQRWGVVADVAAGSAIVSTLSLVYRYGQVSL
ncbi:MAG: hypothetical protein SF187_00670 [Deltaproteobacteria bacterium]|nr:hypothetical protein [Deltaproteobacteria bacterium]